MNHFCAQVHYLNKYYSLMSLSENLDLQDGWIHEIQDRCAEGEDGGQGLWGPERLFADTPFCNLDHL